MKTLKDYKNFINEIRSPKLKHKMIKAEDIKGIDIKNVSTRHLGEIVADYEY